MNRTGTPRDAHDEDEAASGSLVDALLVYAEPLTSGSRVVFVGKSDGSVAERLLDLGARRVDVLDPDPVRAGFGARSAPRGVTVRALGAALDARDDEHDLVLVADLAELGDPHATVARLRRVLAPSGAVVAMGRARLDDGGDGDGDEAPFTADLDPAALTYAELYDLFAASFDEVSLAGVVSFEGAVFAQLGVEDEAPPVSVDTRLASAEAPRIFVVVASQRRIASLDPYAIVQLPPSNGAPREAASALEASVAAAQIKAELLTTQLDEMRERLAVADTRTGEAAARLDRAASERDAALTRAMELEAVLAASQQTLSTLERRLLEAEQAVLQRDERLVATNAELVALRASEEPALGTDVVDVGGIIARAERAEAALASNVADLAQVADTHAAETANYEGQLRDRARFIAELEKELVRREQLVKELVASLEESRESGSSVATFEAATPPPLTPPARDRRAERAAAEELAHLRSKLDALASEVARREGELAARAWRITELENERARAEAARTHAPAEPPREGTSEAIGIELGRARDELDALRQALTQEHAARVAAESGEELARARSELARQAVLLEQIRARQER